MFCFLPTIVWIFQANFQSLFVRKSAKWTSTKKWSTFIDLGYHGSLIEQFNTFIANKTIVVSRTSGRTDDLKTKHEFQMHPI